MEAEKIKNILGLCKKHLPENFGKDHERLFLDEHIETLSLRLSAFWKHVPEQFPEPHFPKVECTPPLSSAYVFFADCLNLQEDDESVAKKMAESLLKAQCNNILILLGQRFTPASIMDARAIPPTMEELLTVANQIENQGLTVGARAWTKHVNRSSDKAWGVVRGSTKEKNAAAEAIIRNILENRTWWNIFHHYKHELVYEARKPTGHGVRWGKSGKEFIGFLEPFLEE